MRQVGNPDPIEAALAKQLGRRLDGMRRLTCACTRLPRSARAFRSRLVLVVGNTVEWKHAG